MSGRYEWVVYGSGLVRPDGTTHSCLSTGGVCSCILTELNTLLDRAEKAEARVAELEREEMKVIDAWRAKQAAASTCPKCGAGFVLHDWTLDPNPKLIRRRCSCGWDSGPVGRFTVTEVDEGANTVTISSEPITKTAPQTPVPAPEGTETGQNQAQTAGTGPSCHDQASRGVAAGVEPAPVLGDPGGYTLLGPFDLFVLGTADERCGLCRKVGSDRLNMACRACAAAIWHNARPRDGKCHPARNCPICTGRIPDPSGPYPTATTRVEATPRPTRPPPGICELWEREGRYFGKYAEDGPDVELSVAQPDTGLVRVLVDPAAAAEVEARTGAYVMQSGGVVTISAIDGVVVEVRHPRAGLPSRDEVAAFLEARWPK